MRLALSANVSGGNWTLDRMKSGKGDAPVYRFAMGGNTSRGQDYRRQLIMGKEDPKVRLATSPDGNKATEKGAYGRSIGKDPTVKLSVHPGRNAGGEAIKADSPSVRLAHVDGAQGCNNLRGRREGTKITKDEAPHLLISYWYRKPWLKHQEQYCYKDWVLDSGAFSADNSGKVIELQEYIEFCQEVMSHDETLTEIFALDVIGDPIASRDNLEAMWAAGVPAIPCYHYGSPESELMHLAENYPKIAIGGCAKASAQEKMRFASEVFARVWPKPIHGFSFGSEAAVLGLPFHSVDATNWELGPCAFGRWKKFGNLNVRGSRHDLREEIKLHLEMQEKARAKWRKQMRELDFTPCLVRMRENNEI